MLPAEIIRKKRNGGKLSADEIQEFISAYVSGDIPDYQVSALLMAIFFKGLDPDETAALTQTMMNSGRTYTLPADRPLVDKHSTGGVGDKVSLILAPLAAVCGLSVPMVSGRGLGHTGGTLDKLESIPGFNIHLSPEQFERQVGELGVAMIGQSDDFVPADKKLYALRDVTATVESIPLICASILSKKAASGARGIVMDVKCGTGAFMQTLNDARALAQGLVATGTALGLPVRAVLTDMNQPLGRCIGNALEVEESVACLRGEGPADLHEITIELTAEMLVLGGAEADLKSARATAEKKIASGEAYERFVQMVERQGGDIAVVEDPARLPQAKHSSDYVAAQDGYFQVQDCRAIGIAALTLGAGRRKTSDSIDPATGIRMQVRIGDKVAAGQPLATILYNHEDSLDECRTHLDQALAVVDMPSAAPQLIMDKLT